MASSSGPVVPSQRVVPIEVTAIIPTLGRETLEQVQKSLEAQTIKPILIIKNSSEDTLIKIRDALNEAKTKTVVIVDDDAVYPEKWIENLSSSMKPKVGFVGGPCLPLINEESNTAEKAIGEVTSTWFGTSNMSYRRKVKGNVRDADETNLVGNGLYNREVFAKILNEEFNKIPPAAWETYVFTRIKQLGYRTLYNPQGVFYHKMRANVFSFSKQIFRSGMGRMNFFKRFPKEMTFKFYMFLPSLFVLYFFLFFIMAFFNIPINGLPLTAYIAFIFLVGYGLKHSSRFQPLYYFVMHFSYGLGMLYGLIRNDKTWS